MARPLHLRVLLALLIWMALIGIAKLVELVA
jgi:hypothetical protein